MGSIDGAQTDRRFQFEEQRSGGDAEEQRGVVEAGRQQLLSHPALIISNDETHLTLRY